jgi:hypothetical protein
VPYRQNFPIPSVIDPPRVCLCIPIPDSAEWRAVFAGLISELTHWFNYERTGDNSGALCAAVWKEIFTEIDWSNMSCCCDQIIIFQWTVDGVLQQSTDDGSTWVNAPQLDPRNNSPVYPPIPDGTYTDMKCATATGAVSLIKEQVGDNLTDDMSRYTLGQLISDWVQTVINTSNPFQALINIATNQIFALIISAVRAALTDDVYATLTCILVSNMSDDLSFSSLGWETVRSDILSQISGVAGLFLEHLVFLLGVVGLTNLVRSGAADSDAVSCCPECSADSWHIVSYDGVDVGSILSTGANWIIVQGGAHPDFGTPWNAMIQTDGNDICCTPTAIEWLTGDHDDENNFGVTCGAARWPGSSNGPVDIGVGEYNTLYLRKDAGSNFTAKITFA